MIALYESKLNFVITFSKIVPSGLLLCYTEERASYRFGRTWRHL